jgi:replicative DNA helicase
VKAETADPAAEAEIIGFIFTWPNQASVARDHLVAADFTDPRWSACWSAWRPGVHYRDVADLAGLEPGAIEHAISGSPSPGMAAGLVRRLLSLSTRRHARTYAAELHAATDDPGLAPEALVDMARKGAADLSTPLVVADPDQNVDEYLAGFNDSYDWLVPDLLERKDRMLITGGEGQGKSMLLAQFATCVSAGVHPWTFQRIQPASVLYVDLENGERLIKRRLTQLREKVPDGYNPANLRVVSRTGGIDITKRGDATWLAERVATDQPDLLVIGPAYRLYSGSGEKGDIGGEDKARQVTSSLDSIRERSGCALLMETHAPHGVSGATRDLRPFGSSVWLRWPEFGIGIRRKDEGKYEVIHWRGPRDKRIWPQFLDHGKRWPWEGRYATGTF